ncbi:MAG: hypothetical protein AAB074_03265 [Planctomycetota bacterium]
MRTATLLFALAAFARAESAPEEQTLRDSTDSIVKSVTSMDLEKVAGAFSKDAVAWLESPEGAAAYKPYLDDSDNCAHLLRMKRAEVKKLAPAAFAKRLAAGFVAMDPETTSKMAYLKFRADGAERVVQVESTDPLRGTGRGHYRFVLDGGAWKLTKSWVSRLHEMYVCRSRIMQVGIYLALYESKEKDYPGDIEGLKRPDLIEKGKDDVLACPQSREPYVYLFPLEGDVTPGGRFMLYDKKPHADGTRIVVPFMGAGAWLDEAQFQEVLRKDLDAIQAKLPEIEKKVQAGLSDADAKNKAAAERWQKGLSGLRSVIKGAGK